MVQRISRLGRLVLVAAVCGVLPVAIWVGPVHAAAAYSGCVTTPEGTAVLYNPTFVVRGTVDATGCQNGIVFDGAHTGSVSGATVSNAAGTPGDTGNGISVTGSAVVSVVNSTIQNNANAGVDASGDPTVTVTNDTFTNNYAGITTQGSAIVHVNNGLFNGGTVGADLSGSSKVDITNVRVQGTCDGIFAYGSARFQVRNGSFTNNGCDGIDLLDSSSATILNSGVTGNEGGVSLQGSPSITLINSSSNSNALFGIANDGGSVTLQRSTVCGNGLVNIEGTYTADKQSHVCP